MPLLHWTNSPFGRSFKGGRAVARHTRRTSMFVVLGATGNTGGVVARTLLDQGKPVRALVRSSEKARALFECGAEVVLGELTRPETLGPVLQGASSLYLLSPTAMTSQNYLKDSAKLLEGVIAAAKLAGISHIVFLSSVGAQHTDGTGPIVALHAGEQTLLQSGIPSTFVRAASFVESWRDVLPVARQDGVLPSFLPAARAVPMVSTVDVGRAAAKALLEGPRGRRVLELSGPVDVTPNNVAEVVSAILGRSVRLLEQPLDAAVATFTAFGASPDVARLLREMYEGLGNGKVAWEVSGAEQVRGKVTLEEALRNVLG
jgi:uncharacterized protein YbjT (DUF2867 family)